MFVSRSSSQISLLVPTVMYSLRSKLSFRDVFVGSVMVSVVAQMILSTKSLNKPLEKPMLRSVENLASNSETGYLADSRVRRWNHDGLTP